MRGPPKSSKSFYRPVLKMMVKMDTPILGNHDINQKICIYIYIWVNYNDLTTTSLEIMVNKGNHPQIQMALIQASEIL